jgi:hypothetical protein
MIQASHPTASGRLLPFRDYRPSARDSHRRLTGSVRSLVRAIPPPDEFHLGLYGHTACADPSPDSEHCILVFGGRGEDTWVSDVFSLDTKTRAWNVLP